MKTFLILPLFFIVGCNNGSIKNGSLSTGDLRLTISKQEFDTLKDWDLAWKLLEPLQKSSSEIEEDEKLKRASPGQRSLFVFYDLSGEVTNGGFIQFYWNGYGKFIPEIQKGLMLIGDTAILSLVLMADKEYHKHKRDFDQQQQKNDWEPLYENLKTFDSLDQLFYKYQQQGILLFEKYIRSHPTEFAIVEN